MNGEGMTMLSKVDRILVVVDNLEQATNNYRNILDAVPTRVFDSNYLNARCQVLALGSSQVELCQPLGDGLAQRRLEARGEGLLCGGVATPDLPALRKRLESHGVACAEADGRIYVDGQNQHGLPLVVSEDAGAGIAGAGPVEFLYELTVVVKSKWADVAERYAQTLGLSREREVGITFDRFGYTGTLMMFRDNELDRIEISEAHDLKYPMGRFAAKHGDNLYMCYVQVNDLARILDNLERHGGSWTRRTTTPVERDGLWIHPKVLNGVLLGVSRHSLAWGWSGHPERILPLDS